MREISIDREKNKIVLTRKFARKADNPTTEEFRLLQEVLKTYPTFRVVNHTIKKNPNKECYKGLTYDYMRAYIRSHEPQPNVESALAELEDKIYISRCHSNGFRYPTIKKWFLEKYSEVAEFGTDLKEAQERNTVEVKISNADDNAAA